METKRKFNIQPRVLLQRARIRLERKGDAAQLSHLQQIDMIRKALAQSPWPVATSGTKRPQVRASFGPAIAVGYESESEYADVELHGRLNFNEATPQLEKFLAPGYRVKSVKSIPRFFPSIEESVNLVFYEVESDLLKGTRPRWSEFWKTKDFPVIKKKADREETINARSCVREWTLDQDRLNLQVRIGPGRTLKPERIIQAVCQLDLEKTAMNKTNNFLKINRTHLCLEKTNGEILEI